MMNSALADSRVRWLSGEIADVSTTILVFRVWKLVFSQFNHMTRLVARDELIILKSP